jgi:hypothetical protein
VTLQSNVYPSVSTEQLILSYGIDNVSNDSSGRSVLTRVMCSDDLHYIRMKLLIIREGWFLVEGFCIEL